MRFIAPKIRNLTYVMPGFQQEKLRDQFGRIYGMTPAFHLEFKGTPGKPHEFDSESPAMKATYRQIARQLSQESRGESSVEEIEAQMQKRVEEYLLEHPDHGKFFNAVLSDASTPSVVAENTCLAKVMDGNGPRPCPNPAAEGSDYCAEHREELAQRESNAQPVVV